MLHVAIYIFKVVEINVICHIITSYDNQSVQLQKLKRRKRQNDRTNLTSQSTGAANVQYLDTRKVSPTLDVPQPDNGWFPSSSTPEIFQTDKSKICE